MNLEIIKYCAEEVRRQGRGPLHVGYMCEAWSLALEHRADNLTEMFIREFGRLIEPEINDGNWRQERVRVGLRLCPLPSLVPGLMEKWIKTHSADPHAAYKEFEEIHPFCDGNGRAGKIIFNWLNGTLHKPEWPKNWWGIANP